MFSAQQQTGVPPIVDAALDRLEPVLDGAGELIDAIDERIDPAITAALRAHRTLHLVVLRRLFRRQADLAFLPHHQQQARLLDTWAHVEDALHLVTSPRKPEPEPVSPTGRVLRMCAEMERYYRRRFLSDTDASLPDAPRPRFGTDIEAAAGGHLDVLAVERLSFDRKPAASRLRVALAPVVGAEAASVIIPVYQLNRR